MDDIFKVILNLTSFDELLKVQAAVNQREEELRSERKNPCKWGKCNGDIVGRKCNRCGQMYR